MTQSKSTKRALLSSVLAMLVCVAMLIGSTFAWFTDSVTSGKNKIVAGNLDVELYYGGLTETEKVDGATNLFTQEDGTAIKWEPGVIAYENFKVVNKGSLALKYQLKMNVLGGNTVDGKSLADVLKVAILENAFTGDRTAAQNLDFAYTLSEFVKNGNLLPKESDTYAVVIYWEPGANDNDYNLNNGKTADDGSDALYIDLGVTLVATQDTVEKDSFDEYYDLGAVYPAVPEIISTSAKLEISAENGVEYTDNAVTITVPGGAVAYDTTATFSVDMTDSTADSVTYEISLTDESGESINLNQSATVTVDIGENLTNVQVYHSGTLMASNDYTYNRYSGILTITTSSFSPFKITYDYDPLATLDGVAYPTAYSALKAAEDGDTVFVQTGYRVTGVLADVRTATSVTLDLQGNTLETTTSEYSAVQVFDGGKLTIKNGTIKSGNHGIMVYGDGTVTLEDVNIVCEDIGVFSQNANNNITVDGGTINSKYFGVYHNGSTSPVSVTIKNATITDTSGNGVYISNASTAGREKQTLVIENSTITGPTAVEAKHTNVTITNSTLIGTATPTGSGANGNGSCTKGYAFAFTTSSAADLATGNVEITDTDLCSVDAETAGYCFVYNVAEGYTVSINGQEVTNYNNYGGEQQ